MLQLIGKVRRYIRPDQRQEALFRYFMAQPGRGSASGNTVLFQCVEDEFYYGLFGQIACALRAQQSVRIEQFVLQSLSVGEFDSVRSLLKAKLVNLLRNFKWTRLYKAFCDGVGYRSTSMRPFDDMVDMYRAWTCWRNLADRQALRDCTVDGVPVGDLVNDCYLRFKPAPTVDLRDSYLLAVIWQAHRDVRRATEYFSRTKPKIYFTSYSTYIQHGIPVRVALSQGVQVFTFSNYQEFAKCLSNSDWYHTKNPDNYAKDFSQMDGQEEKLAQAEAGLGRRISGGVDSATAYMKKSAYTESGSAVPNVQGAAVIFLHDFYDSPHVYREMVFPDFWVWACFTVETLVEAGIPFFVKPHPNQISLSSGVLDEFKKRYPAMKLIPPGITNKQLAEAGMVCAVTVQGTVAHEMAYLGVPTIACARHPHVSFGFCKTAKSQEEYAELLRHAADIEVDKVEMRRESLAFYYMHNLNLGEEERKLRDATWEFHANCAKVDTPAHTLVDELKQISRLSEYGRYISTWLGIIDSQNVNGRGLCNETT